MKKILILFAALLLVSCVDGHMPYEDYMVIHTKTFATNHMEEGGVYDCTVSGTDVDRCKLVVNSYGFFELRFYEGETIVGKAKETPFKREFSFGSESKIQITVGSETYKM